MRNAACLLFVTLLSPPVGADEALELGEARGAYLRHLLERRLGEAAKALDSLEGRVVPPAAEALGFDRALLGEVCAAFASLEGRVHVGDRFPTALGKTSRVRGTVQAADAEGITVVDRGKESRLRWEELEWADVAAFLERPEGAEAEKAPQRRLAGWILVLAGDAEKGWKWVEEASREGGEDAALATSLLAARPSIEESFREAKALSILDGGADRLVEKALSEGFDPAVVDTATYRRRRTDLVPAVRSALEAYFAREGRKEIFRGSLADAGGGAVKISYDFAHGDQIEDWEIGAYTALDYGPWPEVSSGDEDQSHPWRVEGGVLVGVGKAVARHRTKFTGPIALSFTVNMKPLEKGKKKDPAVDHLFLPGILDDGKGHYLTAQSGNHLFWIAGTRPVDLAPPIPGTPAVLFSKDAKVRIEWKDGVAKTSVNGVKCGEAVFREMTVGGVFLYLKGPLTLKIDDVVIEGTIEPLWLEAARAAWIEGALARALP